MKYQIIIKIRQGLIHELVYTNIQLFNKAKKGLRQWGYEIFTQKLK